MYRRLIALGRFRFGFFLCFTCSDRDDLGTNVREGRLNEDDPHPKKPAESTGNTLVLNEGPKVPVEGAKESALNGGLESTC